MTQAQARKPKVTTTKEVRAMSSKDAKLTPHSVVANLSLTDFGKLMQAHANRIASRMTYDQRH